MKRKYSNYIRQTILLVGQGLKLFWNLTNRVCYRQYWVINWYWVINRVHHNRFPSCASSWAGGSVHVGLEIEPYRLNLLTQRRRDARDQNAEMNNKEERSNDAKPSNPSTDFDQTQAAKVSSDGNWIGRVVSRCHSNGRKKQWCKNQQPRHRFWPNPGNESFRRWKLDQTCGFLSSLQWRRRTRWRVGLICFGFDLFMGFWGLEVESGTALGEERKGRTTKKSI